ncbi:dihydrolipoamide acetyltransferase family protein [Geomesophilobacter sediminis]|uniref:Dihydrolipoamide acetyltransferase component of pyruvate dehydrogenase complex n=1 Tax=Geomesophilobacter sediminis TaxID=2798584 RepID=A0A8J7JLK2_9BACT|nr:dihydrolipoamide acetyltransferase family protein [Geomesophilobacter sediminis]MBJ6724985.1 2-oxo acid dehydrogenase subunit E2 [Geomesophilobacter sediminis]
MKEIVMPKLSDTMTEGRLVAWRKAVGETVRRGDVIAEVETDKANMELEAFANGVLLETRIQPGEVAAVGTVIGVIGAAGEKPQGSAPPQGEAKAEPPKAEGAQPEAAQPEPAKAEPAKAEAAAPAAPEARPAQQASSPAQPAPSVKPAEKPAVEPIRTASAPEGIPAPEATQAPFAPETAGKAQEEGAAPAPPQQPKPAAAPPSGPAAVPARHEERAAPVVRRRARELGIDLATVKGSGPEGRILLQDLEETAAGTAAAPAEGAPPPPQPAPREDGGAGRPEEQQLNRFRAAIARTVTESWHIPQFSATVEIDMDPVRALREDLKGAGTEVSTNDVIVKAAALTLEKFPLANGSFAGNSLRMNREINIGIIVGLPDALLIPVIKNCHGRSLAEIARESKRLVERARAGQLSEGELTGGTFTVSNLGMFGVTRFNALIYPPQAAVLAIGAVVERVVAKPGGGYEAVRLMEATLSADHRILDGVYVAQFLAELKTILEHPARLLL